MKSTNNVNSPAHYNRPGAIECIDEMIELFGARDTMAFCKLNAWKYRYRAGLKGGAKHREEDLKKSDWYVRKFKEIAERI